jgi:hypothetical protein
VATAFVELINWSASQSTSESFRAASHDTVEDLLFDSCSIPLHIDGLPEFCFLCLLKVLDPLIQPVEQVIHKQVWFLTEAVIAVE